MWAIGVGDLGLSDEFFWNLSPDLFVLLHERYQERIKREDLRAGLIVATLANQQRTKDTDRVWTPADFFPELAGAVEAQSMESFELQTVARLRSWKNRKAA